MSGSTYWRIWRETGHGGTTGVPTAVCKEMAQARNDRIRELKNNAIEIFKEMHRKKVNGSRKNNYILPMAVT